MYVLKEYDTTLSFEIIIFVYSIFSILLNLLVLYVVNIKSTQEKTVDVYLITWIAAFDILVALSLDITQIAKWSLSITSIEFEESVYCSLSSVVFNGTAIIAIALTAQLSIVRYLTIVKSYSISNVKSNLVSLLIASSIMAIFIINKVRGISRLMPSGLLCIVITKSNNSLERTIYATVMFTIIFPIVFCIPIFYGLISIYYYKSNQRFKEQSGSLRKRVAFYKSKHVAFLALFTALYICSLLPEFIVLMIQVIIKYERSYMMDYVLLFLLFSETVLNPLFVITLHPDSRRKIVSLFKGERDEYNYYQTATRFQYP
ncbi:hypothetical protein K502DRAFT_351956 [Neoconidiobolus thromboides FSU 785]|nr:hypothetical protein K502DRAFT_351956 [Neoconidiobolus thromboides FSU 785]